jgi:hypothetical protein
MANEIHFIVLLMYHGIIMIMCNSLQSRLTMMLNRWISISVVLCLALVACRIFALEDVDRARILAEQTQLLQQSGIETNTAGLIKFLQSLPPDPVRLAKIPLLITELGDDKFDVRELAVKQLQVFGESARPALTAALKSKDLEIVWRAKSVLKELDTGQLVEKQRALLAAVVKLLDERPSPNSVAALLAVLPLCHDNGIADAVCTTLWKSVDSSHAELFRRALKQDHKLTIATAIIGLELASGPESIATIEPFLNNDDQQLRLAAARALVDRQPQPAARALAELTQSTNQEIAAAARGLLNLMTGHKEPKLFWLKWRDQDLPTAKLATLGSKRLDLSLGRESLNETFTSGLGLFQYECDAGRALKVEKGIVALGGKDQPECDQRVFLTAKSLLGQPEFPDRFTVRSRMAAENNNNYGWHLGISIGRVKVLFHPSVDGGAFRIETIPEHTPLLNNQEMGFTPQTDVQYDMTIEYRRTGQEVNLEIAIVECANPKNRYTLKQKLPLEKFGKLERIGLERSGRAGGAALFDEFEIRFK